MTLAVRRQLLDEQLTGGVEQKQMRDSEVLTRLEDLAPDDRAHRIVEVIDGVDDHLAAGALLRNRRHDAFCFRLAAAMRDERFGGFRVMNALVASTISNARSRAMRIASCS